MSSPRRPPVGAWVWERGSFDDPESTVQLAQRIGLDSLQLMVNPKPKPGDRFSLPYLDKVTHLAQLAQDPPSGRPLSIGLTSWLIPDRSFIEDATKLIDICGTTKATTLLWDVEDPWQHGTNMPHDEAAALVGREFGDVTFDVGVTSYSSFPGFATSITEQFAIGVPQAYSPADLVEAGTDQHNAHRAWAAVKGPRGEREIIMGLASYEQDQELVEEKGRTGPHLRKCPDCIVQNMTKAFDAALSLTPAPIGICYWSLEFMSGNEANDRVGSALQELLASSSRGGPTQRSKTYTVERGDTLARIAAAHEITLASLEAANPQITNPNLIREGEVITIP